jgi:hypothetical protein
VLAKVEWHNGVLPRQPTVICRLSVPRYLNRDVVSDLFRALNFSGDVSGPVLLVDGRDKSAQLNRAIERFHLYPIELIFDVLSQRSVDADRSVLIVNSLASGLLVATLGGGRGGDGWWSRAAGHAQKQWQCADAEDQRQPLKGSARVYRCVFHISSFVFDVGLFTDYTKLHHIAAHCLWGVHPISSRQSLARPVTLLRSKLTRRPAPGFCFYDSAHGELLCEDDGETATAPASGFLARLGFFGGAGKIQCQQFFQDGFVG